jgi:V/A-type H+-transporting ATPase subunit D
MAHRPRIPPGRAGRTWLRRRLETAGRGREQLDRKLRILLPEQQRLLIQVDRRRRDWVAVNATARTWLLRATLLGGQDAIRHATAVRPTPVEIVWTTVMGIRYPTDVRVGVEDVNDENPPGNAAIKPATASFRAVLIAGVWAAASEEALRGIDAEIATIRRRLRALDKQLLPWMQDALTAVELSLEQAEQEDGMRLRRATAQGGAREST